jgi:hypothetical protein
MSTYDDASLVLVPSGYKNGVVFSQKPMDANGQLTFTRASGATRVGPNGYIEKVRENLILQSQTFQTTWVPVRSSVSADTTTAPDGTATADTLFDSVDNNLHYVSQNFSSLTGPATISVYAKANQLSQIQLVSAGGTTPMGRGFDLSTGTTFIESVGGVSSNDLGQSITAVGNGWYRCTMSWTATGQTAFWILTSVGGAATYAGTGTNSVYIWGAQLEVGDVATDYIPTTTTAVTVGPVANIPRLDYFGSDCARLLLEPAATALNTKSEDINGWLPAGGTSSANTTETLDPSGYYGADIMEESCGRYRSTSLSSAIYTFSCFAKAKTGTNFSLRIDTPTTISATFNLSTGDISNVSAGITPQIQNYGNGWWRCAITFTQPIVNYVVQTPSTSKCYVWGANLVQSGVLTSYIPTLGSAVTRNADGAVKTGASSFIGQTEGTMFLEITTTNDITTVTPIGISDGTGSNRVLLYVGAGTLTALVTVSGVAQASISSSAISANTSYKMAIAYKANDFAFYVNGVLVGTDTSGTVPACSKFSYDNGSGSAPFYGLNNQALLFKTRLSNADLARLTSI